jgi:hypothetical protein
VSLHQAAQAGHDEYAVLLGLFDSRVSQVLKKRSNRLVVGLEFLGQMAHELSLGHT